LPYGPGDAAQRLIPSVHAALRARQPVALTACDQVRDFIFAPDAADLLVSLLASNKTGAFNIASGQGLSIRTALKHLADRVGGADCLQFGALPMRPGDPGHLVADMTKVQTELGWRAPTSFEAGLDAYLKNVANTDQP
jgi:nucleoside-diphosphate-sugar epimerase